VLLRKAESHGGQPLTERVSIPVRRGGIRPGPVDATVRVVNATGKFAYRDEGVLGTPLTGEPPYAGPAAPGAAPDPQGHFDHLPPGTPEFACANVFAIVKSVEVFWERCLDRDLHWYFLPPYRHPFPDLEVIPFIESENCWSGDGYLEFGYPKFRTALARDRSDPFCENFDAVAHEAGHLILKSIMGNPTDAEKTVEHRAHEEACADMVAVLASLGFDAEVDRLLHETGGRLFTVNPLSRIAEWSPRGGEEIRELFHGRRLPDVEPAGADGDKHTLSLPYSGALYDLLVAIYQRGLMDRNVVAAAPERLANGAVRQALADIDRALPAQPGSAREQIKDALVAARDEVARLLAATWVGLSGSVVTYPDAVNRMITADVKLHSGRNASVIRAVFAARVIAPR
jgi:hypothetical protein